MQNYGTCVCNREDFYPHSTEVRDVKITSASFELLGADFSAHEDDIGDAEADCH